MPYIRFLEQACIPIKVYIWQYMFYKNCFHVPKVNDLQHTKLLYEHVVLIFRIPIRIFISCCRWSILNDQLGIATSIILLSCVYHTFIYGIESTLFFVWMPTSIHSCPINISTNKKTFYVSSCQAAFINKNY